MRFARDLLQLPIRFDAEALAAEVAMLPKSAWMPHPMGFDGNDAVPLVSVKGGINDEFAGPMAATPHLRQLQYTTASMAELGGVWGRSRLMGLGPGAIVPQHVDIHYYWRTHIRIHIPIVTNPGVRFLCGGEEVHMQPGEAWVFDSFRIHEVRNEGSDKRVHLVLDTVGSDRLWELIESANKGASIPAAPWRPDLQGAKPVLHFEQVNRSVVMSSWEMRSHVAYLLENLAGEANEQICTAIDRFIFTWHATWTEFGDDEGGWAHYRRLIQAAREELTRLGAAQLLLNNDAPLYRALDALVFSQALMPPRAQDSTVTVASDPKAA